MQITVFGASGNIGTRVVALALAHGYTVVAFVHSHNPFESTNGLTVITGDITSLTDISNSITGSVAVVSCLGSWGTKNGNVLSTAMTHIIPAMVNQKITRIISLTGSGAFDSEDSISTGQKLFHRLFSLFAGNILLDGEAHLRLLRASDLDWTVIRSPVMRSFGGSGYGLRKSLSKLWDTVSCQSVAVAMFDQIQSTDYLRQAPVIYPKSGK